MSIKSINPTNDEEIKTYAEYSESQILSILSNTRDAFLLWRTTSLKKRIECFLNVASILIKDKVMFAKLMALEMGKPISQGYSEIEKCALTCHYYAEHVEAFLKDEYIKTEMTESFVSYQPLGVILAIMPWNFPFWQVFRAAIPAIMAGNAVVLKHSSNVPGCALAIENIFQQAGFPKDLFRTFLMASSKVASLIENDAIKAVTLTGSSKAGADVASKAGSCLKKLVLELGGSDPYIVLADADIKKAAQICARSRMLNGGQSCVAAKRFIVEESVVDEFRERFIEEMKAYNMGDPFEESCKLGPMARIDLRNELHRQVNESIGLGAKLILGGDIPPRNGAFYPATILENVNKGMPAYEEELFGPVASIIIAKDETEAIHIANDTIYGLGAAVFTKNLEKGRRIARDEIEAGCCFVNDFVKSDPRLPFGGIKYSGYGRELGVFGIHEFTNIKTVNLSFG